eukprot:7266084-Pyramimonas_sp.AAC.1
MVSVPPEVTGKICRSNHPPEKNPWGVMACLRSSRDYPTIAGDASASTVRKASPSPQRWFAHQTDRILSSVQIGAHDPPHQAIQRRMARHFGPANANASAVPDTPTPHVVLTRARSLPPLAP